MAFETTEKFNFEMKKILLRFVRVEKMSIGKCYIEEERRKKSCFSSYYRAMIQFWSWNLLKFEFLFAISICFINTKHCTTLKNKWISDLICPPSQQTAGLAKIINNMPYESSRQTNLLKQVNNFSRMLVENYCLEFDRWLFRNFKNRWNTHIPI